MDRIRYLYIGEGDFGRYKIVERIYNDRPSRLLLAGKKNSPQSGLALDDNPELLFEYNQRFLEITLSLQPQSILVIGGGAFTLPKAIIERLGIARIDVVEVDPLLPDLARKYFSLPHSSKLNIITQDGRTYIDNCQTNYDLIIVDAFSEYDIPRSLLTAEAATEYARLLAPTGTIALNVISKYRGKHPTLAHQLMATFRESFVSHELYPADPDDTDQKTAQNLIFAASHQESLSLDYLMSTQIHIQDLNDQSLILRDQSLYSSQS